MAVRQRVVLYNPQAVFYDLPLALLSLAAQLPRSEYEVVIVDARVSSDPHDLLLEACEGALCLGVTVLTGAPLRDALAATRRVRGRHAHLPIVWGGWHPSLFPRQVLESEPCVDFAVQGQGEVVFRELVAHLAEGSEPSGIPGLWQRQAGVPVAGGTAQLVDMNELRPVDFGRLDIEPYFLRKKRRQLDYLTSTGCVFRCAFCADPFVYQRRWSGLDSETVVDELQRWVRDFDVEDVNFQDETFFTYTRRTVQIAEGLLRGGVDVSWAATLRADQAHRLSDEEFSVCVQSGMRRVLIGVESGSQEMMDWLKKDIRLEHVLEAAERCRRYGVHAIFPFIVGFPGESDESFSASLALAARLRSMSPGFSTPIFYFKPYPGSSITQQVVEQGYELPSTLDEWAEFDYIGSAGPWVTPERHRQVDHFRFYNRLQGAPLPALLRPVRWLARWRIDRSFYGLPLERLIGERLRPVEQLS